MEDTNNKRCAANNLNASMRDTLILPSSEVALASDDFAKRGGELRTSRSAHLHECSSPPIDLLPHELLLAVFKFHIDLDTPVQSLVTLILVCKLWRNIVEGTPSLWCRISGREELSSIRKSLTMAKDAHLEIKYLEGGAKMNPEAFFAQIDERIALAKSLTVGVRYFIDLPAILQTTSSAILETLDLVVLWGPGSTRDAVTLFGGKPASPALKNFRVNFLPIALAPLRLSGLRSLGLINIPIASAEEVITILMESPALEDCSLGWLDFSTKFTPSEHALRRLLSGESSITDANLRAIWLLHLRHFSLYALPISFIHFLLSNMQASTLLSFSVQGELNDSPASELLTADISHLARALKGSTITADRIEISSWEDKSWALCVGMLNIEFGGVRAEPRHVEETLDWVYGHLGEHLKAFPTSLAIFEPEMRPELMLWLGMNLRVTNLELWTAERTPQPRQIVSLLSRPVESLSNRWALPDLEFLDTNVIDEAGKWEIFKMVEARHSFIQAQEDQGRGDVGLKPFKEIRLNVGGDNLSEKQAPHATFLTAIESVGRGAEIWWEEVKWVGSRAGSP